MSLCFAPINLTDCTNGINPSVLSVQTGHESPGGKGYMQSKQNVTGLHVILGPQFLYLYDKGFPKIRS